MKNLIITTTLLCTLFLFGNNLQAQKLVMENDEISYNDQLTTAIKVTIAPNKGDVRDAWENFVEDNFDAKVKGNGFFRKSDVLSAKGVKIPTVSNKQIDLFMEVLSKGQGSEMNVFASFGNNMSITSETFPLEYRGLENLTLGFLEEFLTDFYRDQVEDSQELVSDIEDIKNDLQEDLSENKEEISELKDDNEQLVKDIADKKLALEKATIQLKSDKDDLAKLRTKLRNVDDLSNDIFSVRRDEVSYDKKLRAAIMVFMEPEKDKVRDEWEDFLEDKYDFKVKGNGIIGKDDVMRSREIILPMVSDKKIDLFAEVVSKEQGSQLMVFASFGYDVHITPAKFPKEFQGLENFTMEFVSEFLTDYYQDQVKESQELVADLEDDKNDMQEEYSKNQSKMVELGDENVELKSEMNAKGIEMEKAAEKLEIKKTEQKKLDKKLKQKKENKF